MSLAGTAQRQVNSLGMAISRLEPGQVTDGLLTQVDQVRNDYGAVLNDRAGWHRVTGVFQAVGNEQHFTIGCFEPTASIAATPVAGATASPLGGGPYDMAYYYADDALLAQVPQAGPDFVATCGNKVPLPVSGTALPASVGATYQWTSSTDPAFTSNTLVTSVGVPPATTPTVYTLTITLPGQQPISSQTTLNVVCCFKDTPRNVVLDQGNYDGQSFAFSANTDYYVPRDLYLTNGTFRVPEGSTLYLEKDVNIFVDENTTLLLEGGRATAACGQMWGGIYVDSRGQFGTTPSPAGIRPGIAHSQYGVVFSGPYDQPFQIADADFLFNYQSVTFQALGSYLRRGSISGCTFDSSPLGMLPPYQYQSASNFYYSLRHVAAIQSPNLVLTLDRNILRGSMFGVYVLQSTLPALTSNRFASNFVAGVYAGASSTSVPGTGLTTMRGNTLILPSGAVHDANPPQLATAYANAAGSSTQEAYGLLANGPLAYQPQGNLFAGPGSLQLTDPVPTYRQIAVSATTATPSSGSSIRIRTNTFENVYEGLRLQLKSVTAITENEFDNCVYGIHLVGPGAGGPPNPFQLQCNTFIWYPSAQLAGNNTPRGIFIGPNYPVQLTGNFNPTVSPVTRLLKNYFVNYMPGQVIHVWNDASNPSFNYDTFAEIQYGANGYDQLTTSNVTVSSLSTLIARSNDCANDNYPYFGIQAPRPGSSHLDTKQPVLSNLETPAPNPATDRTLIRYQLSPSDATQPAALLVRSLISGATVREMPLGGTDTTATLATQDLSNGVYLVTLVANGRVVANRRLLVSH